MAEPFSVLRPGVFLVGYPSAAEMEPGRQAPLVLALGVAAASSPTRILFEVSDHLGYVPLSVPTFWLETVDRPDLRIEAMAICSRSMAVQLAAKGFRFSNRLRKRALEVGVFDDLPSATRWILQEALPKAG